MSPQKAISCPILLLSIQTIPVTECNSVKQFVHVFWIDEAERLEIQWYLG